MSWCDRCGSEAKKSCAYCKPQGRRKRRGRPPGSTNQGTEKRRSTASRLKARGWTWARIGERLGLSRQGASQMVKRANKTGTKK